MKTFSTLGWYDLAAYAIVRRACCPGDVKALSLPEPIGRV